MSTSQNQTADSGKTNAVRPNNRELLGWALAVFSLYSLIASIPFLLAINTIASQRESYTGTTSPGQLCLAFAVGSTLGAYVTLHFLNRRFWTLTDSRLSVGIRRQISYSLIDIDRIIPSVPMQARHLWLLESEALISEFMEAHAHGLVIRFTDGSLMPFNVHSLPDGTRLMIELVTRFKNRLDPQYAFSANDLKQLKRTEFNMAAEQR
jgi:hypothetical protein